MNDALARISQLAHLMVKQRKRHERLLAAADAAKRRLDRTEREDLPALMQEFGITELKLSDGSTVSVVPDVICGIPEAKRPAAAEWLRANGFGGLLKTQLTVAFERGGSDEARRVAGRLHDELGIDAQVAEAVHPQTLKSFVREQLAQGRSLPEDCFTVLSFNRANLKLPRRASTLTPVRP